MCVSFPAVHPERARGGDQDGALDETERGLPEGAERSEVTMADRYISNCNLIVHSLS